MQSASDVHGPSAPWRLLEGYRPLAGGHDEVMAAPGRLASPYEPLVRSLEALGRHEFAARWESAKRTIRDNGVTYNVYGDPEGVDRPWTLDMLPLLIGPAEWSRIEAALLQRSRVLNLVLADLYGPQRLLHDGLLPPSLVLANPARHRRAARCASAPARRRSRARSRRQLAGTRRSHAGALGRRLRAREPDRAVTQPAGSVSGLPGAAAGGVLPWLS
jgi:hypothetical protein